MNYIFFGTPRFAEIVLDKLIGAHMPPAAIVANPDRPVGRKKILTAPATKQRALREKTIAIFQPEKLDRNFIAQIKNLKPDFFVVAAYAKIIPQSVLDIPERGTLGVHPSLLPKLRGASPIQSAILEGADETGATLYLMDEKMDHGPIVAQKASRLGADETYPELEKKLAELGADLLIEAAPGFLAGKRTPMPQEEALATFTKKFKTDDGFVAAEELAAAEQGDLEKATQILRKINAFNPEPGAWTRKDNKRIKLLRAKLSEHRLVLLERRTEGQTSRTI